MTLDKYFEKYFTKGEAEQSLLQLEITASEIGINIKKNDVEYKTEFEFLDELAEKWDDLSKE